MDPMESKADDSKPVVTRREAEPEKHRKLMVERHRRRTEMRKLAKRNGHRLGHNNRKCKRCGATRNEGQGLAMFGTACAKQ